MSARTESAGWPEPRAGEAEGATLVWLDALAGGICTPEAFLRGVQDPFQEDPDKTWQVLSLLDQYYRRGKIQAELFHSLKSRLEGSALSGDERASASVRPRASSAAVTAPAAASPNRPAPASGQMAPASPDRTSPESLNPPAPARRSQAAPLAPSPTSPVSPDRTSPESLNPPAPARRRQAAPLAPSPTSPVSPHRASPESLDQTAPAVRSQASPLAPSATSSTAPGRTSPESLNPTASAPRGQAAPASPTQESPAPRPEVRELAIGDVLRGRYRIRGVLGHGGMGTVFDAIDEYRVDLPRSGQRIAIKVLRTVVARREELLAELQREFQHLQLLSHPNIVRVHEFDRDGDNVFFTMEALVGALLSQVLGTRNGVALPRPYTLAIMRDVGAALAHAHSRGVVHGDINPQNIFITNDGELRILDFGASHRLLRDVGFSQRSPVATAGYASCQLLEGQRPDARDDLFAFACVAYLLLSGQHPFPRHTALEARARRVRPPRPPGLTGNQWRVLREGLRWERDRRPAEVQKWLDRFGLADAPAHLPPLPEVIDAPPPRKRGVASAAAVIAIFVLLAAGGYWAVVNHDSLVRLIMPAAPVVTQEASPPSSPPAITEPTPAPLANPAPSTATPARTAPKTTAPSAAAPAVAAPAYPIPTTAAPTTAAPSAATALSAAPPAATPESRAATASRPSPSETSARTGDAGPIRIEMAADTVDVGPDDGAALITVRRRGNLHGDASFRWWTESGTARPGRDFAAEIPRVQHIADGSRGVSLIVPILSTPRGKSRSFYVVIDRTESGGAALGARTLTMVTILPTD